MSGFRNSILPRLDDIGPRTWAFLLLLAALIERLALWVFYPAATYSDTAAYRRLADAILNDWIGYDGTRTPGYPFYLALLRSDQAAYVGQLLMGVAITLLLFYIIYLASGLPWLGALAALAYMLNLSQLFFEAALLSEAPTTFWTMLAMAGTFTWLCRPDRRSLPLAAATGLAAGLAFLTRPLFIYLPFLLALAVAAPWDELKNFSLNLVRKLDFRAGLAVILPAVLIISAWMSFIHRTYNEWALNTMTGFHLVQHTGAFFDYVPDKYAGLRDTYIRYRDAHIAKYGTQANAIWDAIPELQKVSGLTFFDLSRLMAHISVELILAHPDLYLRSVLQGWVLFWYAPTYWQPALFRWAGLVPLIEGAVTVERGLLVASNLVFLASTLLALVWKRFRQEVKPTPEMLCLAATIWLASLAQTVMDHGDNPRFLVPLQALVVAWVIWLVWRWVSLYRARSRLIKTSE